MFNELFEVLTRFCEVFTRFCEVVHGPKLLEVFEQSIGVILEFSISPVTCNLAWTDVTPSVALYLFVEARHLSAIPACFIASVRSSKGESFETHRQLLIPCPVIDYFGFFRGGCPTAECYWAKIVDDSPESPVLSYILFLHLVNILCHRFKSRLTREGYNNLLSDQVTDCHHFVKCNVNVNRYSIRSIDTMYQHDLRDRTVLLFGFRKELWIMFIKMNWGKFVWCCTRRCYKQLETATINELHASVTTLFGCSRSLNWRP